MIAALILLAQGQLPAAAAGGVIDQGVLVIRADTQEVARETFRLLERRVGENTDGWLLDASARWGGARGGRPAVYSPVLEVGRDSSTLALSFGVSGGPVPLRITGRPGRRRFTLRYVSPGVERARELPGDSQSVVIDDSVFTPYLFVAWRGGRLNAVYARTADRATLQVQDLGSQATTLNRDPVTLRHLVVTGGRDGPVHVWLGDGSRIMKVELPDRKLVAERQPD